jgi:predicted nucleic acid-binding protein
VLLLPELLSKPLRENDVAALAALGELLGRLHLLPADEATAALATSLSASYGLRAADAVHLASAVAAGAARFVTNNAEDFPTSIVEIEITYPAELPEPTT